MRSKNQSFDILFVYQTHRKKVAKQIYNIYISSQFVQTSLKIACQLEFLLPRLLWKHILELGAKTVVVRK